MYLLTNVACSSGCATISVNPEPRFFSVHRLYISMRSYLPANKCREKETTTLRLLSKYTKSSISRYLPCLGRRGMKNSSYWHAREWTTGAICEQMWENSDPCDHNSCMCMSSPVCSGIAVLGYWNGICCCYSCAQLPQEKNRTLLVAAAADDDVLLCEHCLRFQV